MIKFVHTADIHFGMENYGRIDPQTGIHTRLLDFEKALNCCIDFAIEKNVDLFVFSGDAYKTPYPTPTHQKMLMGCFLKLHRAKIPIVMVVGNHDHPLTFGKANALEIFGQVPIDEFFVISKPSILNIKTKSGPVQIVGIPWPTKNSISLNNDLKIFDSVQISSYITNGVSKIIKDLAEQLDKSIPAILMGHMTVDNGIFSGSEKRAICGSDPVFMVSQLAIEPFDYVALGHLHRFQDLNKNGQIPVVYSGSIERIDFGERKEEKGFCYVEIKSKYNTVYDFISVPTRKFIQVDVEINDSINQTDNIIDALSHHTLEDSVIKIVYYLKSGLKDRVDLSIIQKVCANAMYIAGIVPVKEQEKRARRNVMQLDTSLKSLLNLYFDIHVEYAKDKNDLIKKALILESEIFNNEYTGS